MKARDFVDELTAERKRRNPALSAMVKRASKQRIDACSVMDSDEAAS